VKRLLVCVVSFVCAVSAVASAESVSAPRAVSLRVVVSGGEVVPLRGGLGVYVPVVDPVVEARRLEREGVVADAVVAGFCAEWAGLAFDVGWPKGEIPRLLRIMFRESRCLPGACSVSDSGRVCRDWGLMQINEYSWRRSVVGQGYVMSDMWVPEHNLRFALWVFNYSLERNGDGWLPWRLV